MTARFARPELLAPAGDDASLSAALAAGADAVYLGLDEGLNARARATNFSLATLPATADRVHRAGARLYLTLNTLVFEHELEALERILRGVAQAGADALIVQDPAVALLARAVAPTLEVHASTQMTISSAEGVAFAQSLGITRVVAPRELSVDDLAQLKARSALELEVFIHGALCMSWSGQCLTSEAWGGRSANRGQCAQSCRLPYQLVVDGAVRPLGEIAYLLSPLDLAGFRAVKRLAELGVSSLKIEGRLKGPAYVTTAVGGYRRWLDALETGATDVPEESAQVRGDLGRMAVAYSRGFSDGFLTGGSHQHLVEGRFPKHRGALVGEVVSVDGAVVTVRRAERASSGGIAALPDSPAEEPADTRVPLDVPELIAGVGVGFDTGHPQEEEPGGAVFAVEPTRDGWRLTFGRPGPDLTRVRPGHKVWLSSDPRLTKEADAAVALGDKGPPGRIPVSLRVSGRRGEPLQVVATAEGPVGRQAELRCESDAPLTPATGAGLGQALLEDKLGGFGGTPFRLARLDCAGLEPGLFVAVSSLKALRRGLAQALEAQVLARARHEVAAEPAAPKLRGAPPTLAPFMPHAAPALLPLVRTPEQLEAVIAVGLPHVELDWMELVGLEKAVLRAREAGLHVTIATTRVQKPTEAGIDARLERLRPDALLVRHWGGVMQFAARADKHLPVHGDFSLNVTNSVTARHLLGLGLTTLTAAHDLDEAQLHALLDHVPPERLTVTVHHHLATFHTEHCVYAHTLSHGRDFRSCGRPCERHRLALEDRTGKRHPVIVDVGCRNTVFNAQAQSAAAVTPDLLARGVRRFRAEFVWEDQPTCEAVLRGWLELLGGQATPERLVARIGLFEQFGVTAGTMRVLEP